MSKRLSIEPTAPSSVAATPGATTVSISWSPSKDSVDSVAGYLVYRNSAKLSQVTTTSYTDSRLTDGTTYSYYVVAYDASGHRSSASSTVSATPVDTTPPSTPSGLTTSAVSASGASLNWTASTDNVNVTGYDVYLNGTPQGTTTATTWSFTGLSCGTSHTLGVSAYDAAGNVSTAASVPVTTGTCPPSSTRPPAISGPPTQGQALNASTGAWSNSPTSYAYQWQHCTSSGCTNITGATSTSYLLPASDVGDTIDVVVTASNTGGSAQATSAQTAVVAAAGGGAPSNTAAPVVSGLAFPSDALSSTNGTWTNSPMSYTYQWQDCDSSGASCVNATGIGNSCTNSGTGCTYTVVPSDEGHTLRVVVAAQNTSGSSSLAASNIMPGFGGTVPGLGAINVESFNGRFDLGNDGWNTGLGWVESPVSQLGATYVADSFASDGNGNQALDLTSCPFSHWVANANNTSDGGYAPICSNGENATSESPYGQQNGPYLECIGRGGYRNPCGFENTSSGTGSGQDAWYRLRVYFTPSFHPGPDSYNWLLEPFDNTACSGCHSPAIGIATGNTASQAGCSVLSPGPSTAEVCSNYGTNPALEMQYSGGSTSSPQIVDKAMPSNSLQLGVWYDIVLHMKYSTTNGLVQFWINTGSGWTEEWNISGVPTAYYTGSSAPDCTVPGNSCQAITNEDIEIYSHWLTWSNSIHYQDLVAGPNAASVGEPGL